MTVPRLGYGRPHLIFTNIGSKDLVLYIRLGNNISVSKIDY